MVGLDVVALVERKAEQSVCDIEGRGDDIVEGEILFDLGFIEIVIALTDSFLPSDASPTVQF